MLLWSREKREQEIRNREKAQRLIDEHGDRAEDFVRSQIEATAWEIRHREHWQRIERHVKALLR